MREEKRALKEWLTSLLPDDFSRNDVAYELGVSRKTISSMLNPDADGFGNGLTMLRYLQLVGAVAEAPAANPASSHLGALEASVENLPTKEDLTRSVESLRVAIQALAIRDTGEGHQPAAAEGPLAR